MKTILQVLQLTTDFLQQHGVNAPRREAEEILSMSLGIRRLDLYVKFEQPLRNSELATCREFLKRRLAGEPVQYIAGEVSFYGNKLRVNRDVLIPRPETEILVDRIVKELSAESVEGKVLWDVCCGSGCIGIAIKRALPSLEVVLSDLSEEAVAVAKENGHDIEVLQGDLLSPFEGRIADFIVCNPPYIADEEFASLQPEVRDYEPKMALVSGESGLEIYRRLAEQLPLYLKDGARVWMEVGAGQGEGICQLFSNEKWEDVSCEKDWSGHDRFFRCTRTSGCA